MAFLSQALTRSRPNLPTRQALLVLDLQNDFVSPDGNLPVTLLSGFEVAFASLVAAFRESGEVAWVRSEYPSSRTANFNASSEFDDVIVHADPNLGPSLANPAEDSEEEMLHTALRGSHSSRGTRPRGLSASRMEQAMSRVTGPSRSPRLPSRELFLANTGGSPRCCMPGSEGINLASLGTNNLDPARDIQLLKRCYSAFNSTNLLVILQSRLVTELYLCGSLTNVGVHATASDAVRHGFLVHVIEDCLGYRNLSAHEEALTHMTDFMGVRKVLAQQLTIHLQDRYVNSTHASALTSSETESPTFRSREPSVSGSENPPTYKTGRKSSNIQRSFPGRRMDESGQDMSHSGPQIRSERTTAISQLLNHDEESLPTGVQTNLPPSTTSAMRPLEYNPLSEKAAPEALPSSSLHERKDIREKTRRAKPLQHPVLGPDDVVGEGDSRVVYDVLSGLGPHVFSDVKNEVYWQKMYHARGEVPRLVCVQGSVEPSDGSMPVYRHPTDQSLPLLHFSHTVQAIKDRVQQTVGHPMNHVLIQLYRGGHDFISEHSDKTLDIVRGSSIVNVSIGAQRTMRLRTKKSGTGPDGSRKTQLVPLPDGSVFVLGLRTNMAWLHGINADKRPSVERSEEEQAFHGERMSLTFRHIGTFLNSESNLIWGQGACAKAMSTANEVINGDPQFTQRMVNAFGFENQETVFDWDAVYGRGFDVLHFTAPPAPQTPLLFFSGDHIPDLRVKIYLEALNLPYHNVGISRTDVGHDYNPTLCFRDADRLKTQIYGDIPILTYLDHTYARNPLSGPVLEQAERLMWELQPPSTDYVASPSYSDARGPYPGGFLTALNQVLSGGPYVAGEQFSMVDCAFWPVVQEIVKAWVGWREGGNWPRVREYHGRLLNHPSVERALWSNAGG